MTLARFLKRLTPAQMERELGLPIGELSFGAVVYSFARMPMMSEVEYELTTKFPDGQAYTFMSEPRYPPGNPHIHQWCIVAPSGVPVDLSSAIELGTHEQFPG